MTNDEALSQLLGAELSDAKLMQIAKLTEVGLSVATVVHEMRQPISAQKIALQLMRERLPEDAELLSYMRDALEQTTRLEELVDRTREFMRTGPGKLELQLEEVVDAAVSLIRWQLERKHIKLEVEVEPGLPPISGDRSYLEQMLVNLLINAKDALASSKGKAVVSVILRKEPDNGLSLIVADTGAGVSEEMAERIFQPFFTTKPVEKGSGLGLFIARRVAADHGARIKLMRREELAGLGREVQLRTGFQVRFFSKPPREATAAATSTERTRSSDRRRALVVDDEEVILRLLSKLLEGEGFACTSVKSGESALDELERGWYDLLVTDKNLPGISGIEVARFARNAMPWIPILVVSGYASEESAREAAALGVADYVIKPIDVDDFRMRVSKVMRHSRGRSAEHRRDSMVNDAMVTVPPPNMLRATVPPGATSSQNSQAGVPSIIPIRPTVSAPPPEMQRSATLSVPPVAAVETPKVVRGGAAAEVASAIRKARRQPLRVRPEEIDIRVAVLLIASNEEARTAVGDAIRSLGCDVAAFGEVEEARIHATSNGFEVLVADREILLTESEWLLEVGGVQALGTIAIMERAGVDKAIEAIHIGARGVLSPPFDEARVIFEFRRSVARLIAENR